MRAPDSISQSAKHLHEDNNTGHRSLIVHVKSYRGYVGRMHTKVPACVQRKLVEAEKYLKQALAEAKQGFGEDDPHVAGACNNLAELHRLKKDFNAAEVLYQEVCTASIAATALIANSAHAVMPAIADKDAAANVVANVVTNAATDADVAKINLRFSVLCVLQSHCGCCLF